jgi:ribosomal protein S18 acetylase RimI-like enzyme
VEIQIIKDRSALEEYFRQDIPLHLYSLGDLDDFYWPRLTCYGTRTGKALRNITPFYRGEDLPVLLAFGKLDPEYLRQLQSLLPDRIYAHLSPGHIGHFSNTYQITEYGDHFKMALVNSDPIQLANTEGTFQVVESDLPEVNELYQQSYPDNAFDPRMLKSGRYVGIRRQGRLVSIAGIHAYSAAYRVAALGNITTHPELRGRGYGRAVTARLCQILERTVDFIGLHVKCANQGAISLYESLGFRISSVYGEFSLQKGPK